MRLWFLPHSIYIYKLVDRGRHVFLGVTHFWSRYKTTLSWVGNLRPSSVTETQSPSL